MTLTRSLPHVVHLGRAAIFALALSMPMLAVRACEWVRGEALVVAVPTALGSAVALRPTRGG